MANSAKIGFAAAAAFALLGTSMVAVDAGNTLYSHTVSFETTGAVTPIVSVTKQPDENLRHANRTHYQECHFEKQKRWSNRRGRAVMRNVKVCD